MSGNALFSLGGRPLYGLVVRQPGSLRFRICSEEWDSLNLCPGHTVPVEIHDGKENYLLVSSVVPLDTGFTWVYLTRPIVQPTRFTSKNRQPISR